jgi:hypothetical protein
MFGMVVWPRCLTYPAGVTEEEARAQLAAAAAEYDAARLSAENTRLALYDAVRAVAPVLKQVDIVKATGWTREHIRQIVGGEKT